ncbi:hypothetical protein RhiirC2_800500 [Rhizophagus irregularis]|uniref:Uncharacterized protein n=2 Tax=Rhizophagus irregularis TaxID=588596 RepID=A0A2N1M3I9_9GLOM|nr:hypothetical protein RhiirC2_800500 [Rhizophagus irregularis]
MPAQLSTVLYISNYQEKISSGFIIGNATGYTRLDETNGDKMQKFNIVAFYPIDDSKPCYIPKIQEGQVLSVANSKFSIGANNEIDLILAAASILDIDPKDAPVHQISVVGVTSSGW